MSIFKEVRAGSGGGSVALSDALPLALGTADPGTSPLAARADHVHPLQAVGGGSVSQVSTSLGAGVETTIPVAGDATMVQVLKQVSASVSTDTSLDFDTTDEGAYIQEDAVDGTDFSAGRVSLHATGGFSEMDGNDICVLHFEGDLSDSASPGRTFTAVGNAITSSAWSRIGTQSLYLDGSGDYITHAADADFDINQPEWTIEFFVRNGSGSLPSPYALLLGGGTTATYHWQFASGWNDPSDIYFVIRNDAGWANLLVTPPGALNNIISANGIHVSLEKWSDGSSTKITFYVDGQALATGDWTTDVPGIDPNLNIGAAMQWGSYGFYTATSPQYYDEFRISNIGRYRGQAFAVPTTATPRATYVTTQPYYVTTSDGNHLSLAAVQTINGCTIGASAVSGTSIKALVSFDGRTTWKQWSGSAWVDVAGGLADLQTGNSIAEIEAGLTGYAVGAGDSYLDFAFDLSSSDASRTPSLDQISVDLTLDGVYDLAVAGPLDGAEEFGVRFEGNVVRVKNQTGASQIVKINLVG